MTRNQRIWTERETEILKKLYLSPKVTIDEMLKVFPERSLVSIQQKARALGLRRPIGTKIDEDYLKKLMKVVEVE